MQVISGKLQTAKKVVIYGPEGVGKSSFSSMFPNPVFVDTEGSTTELNVIRLPRPTSWQMISEQVDWAKSQFQMGVYKTLIIDTADWAERLCILSICAVHSKKGIEDFGYGKGYVFLEEEFGRFLNKLSDVVEAGMHVVLVAHSQIIKFDQPDEMGSYDRYQLKLSKKVAPLVKEWADMLLFLNYKTFSVAADENGKKHKVQGGRRVIHTTHHPAWDAKNRQGLPDELPLEYAQIAHIFNDAAPAPVQQPMQQPEVPLTAPPIQPTQAPQQMASVPEVALVPPVTPTPPIQQPEVPVPQVTVPPQQTVQKAPTQPPVVVLDPAIPKALQDLMIPNEVKEYEIQSVVSQKGYYPLDTPIINYDPSFIDGVLVAAWPQVFQMVIDFRESLPF
ncbi:ATP-binding protein [Sporosarcina sp. CAU 1771]